MEQIFIRAYKPEDCAQMAALFYKTVHTVNARDYTKEQLRVWASGYIDQEAWNRSFLMHDTLVAAVKETIVGFGDMDNQGYLDRLYVHKNYQRRGIADALCSQLEERCHAKTYVTHASITARPFFEKRGYRVKKEQQVFRQGIALTNFVMEKCGPEGEDGHA